MSKKKNKKSKLNSSEQKTIIETPSVVHVETKYEASLKTRLAEIKDELDTRSKSKAEALQYLSTNHRLYQSIKDNAFEIQRDILSSPIEPHKPDQNKKADGFSVITSFISLSFLSLISADAVCTITLHLFPPAGRPR